MQDVGHRSKEAELHLLCSGSEDAKGFPHVLTPAFFLTEDALREELNTLD